MKYIDILKSCITLIFVSLPMHAATKSCISKDPFKVQDRTMDFNVTEHKKFMDISDFTLQLTFKKLPSVEFNFSIEEDYP